MWSISAPSLPNLEAGTVSTFALSLCDEQIDVKVYAASNFKLHIIFVFLDFDRLSILFSDCDQISSILRGMMMRYREHSWNKEWQETRRREKYKI